MNLDKRPALSVVNNTIEALKKYAYYLENDTNFDESAAARVVILMEKIQSLIPGKALYFR